MLDILGMVPYLSWSLYQVIVQGVGDTQVILYLPIILIMAGNNTNNNAPRKIPEWWAGRIRNLKNGYLSVKQFRTNCKSLPKKFYVSINKKLYKEAVPTTNI